MQSETQRKKKMYGRTDPLFLIKKKISCVPDTFLAVFPVNVCDKSFLYGDTHEKCLFLRRRLWLRPLADTEDSRGT